MEKNSALQTVLAQIAPKNEAYLLDFIERVNTYSGIPIDQPQWMAGNKGTGESVILLPGSFYDFRYMRDVAQGLGMDERYSVWGLNYPGRILGDTDRTRINQFLLADYVGAVYQALLERQKSHPGTGIFLAGHSLGTITIQMLLFVAYSNQLNGREESVLRVNKVAVIGGGPPRLGFGDYLLTFATRFNTLNVVTQMVNRPEKFMSPAGAMGNTLGGEERYQEFIRENLIYQESAPLMAEAFMRGDYAFVPAKLLEALHVRALFVYSPQDRFVHKNSSQKAAEQWGARPLEIAGGHAEMMFGQTGIGLGKQIAQFFQEN